MEERAERLTKHSTAGKRLASQVASPSHHVVAVYYIDVIVVAVGSSKSQVASAQRERVATGAEDAGGIRTLMSGHCPVTEASRFETEPK